MEITLLKEELEYIPDLGGDFILDKLEYLNHFPELANLKNSGNKLMFYIVKLKSGDVWYVAAFDKKTLEHKRTIIKHYKTKQSVPNNDNVKSISIKCDRIYHITYGFEILL
jgi:hypothetical protein